MTKPSPIVLSLLLAATLCVDAVAAYWWFNAQSGETALNLYFGLMFGNLSVICVWASHCRRASQLAWITPFVAGLLIALLSGGLSGSGPFVALVLAFTGLFWIHVAVLLALLWVWKQTRFAKSSGQAPIALPWQVSLMQLLVVTTVAAVILTVWTNSKLLQRGSDASWIPWDINNIVVAFAALVIFSRPWLFITRTAALAAAALGCGALFFLVLQSMDQELGGTGFPFWQNLFHAGVLLLWLQFGGITAAAEPPAASADE